MNLTDLKAEFGAYYLKTAANLTRVLRMLMQGSELAAFATTIMTQDTKYQLAKSSIGEILQSFQTGWTPKGTVKFEPNEIKLFKMKIDKELYPDDIEASWLGFLASEGHKRSDWPLVRYVVEELIIPKIIEDRETKAIYGGVYVAPTAGTANAASATMDGLEKQMNDGLTAETINEITLGTLTTANIFDKVEQFADEIDELYQGVTMPIFMSKKWERAYHRAKRNIHGPDPSYQKGSAVVDFTENRIIGLACMKNKNRIWSTPKANLIRLMKKDNAGNINIEELKRQVFLMTDFWEGYGFGIDQAVWCSDGDAPV